jgi:hypothetical protein
MTDLWIPLAEDGGTSAELSHGDSRGERRLCAGMAVLGLTVFIALFVAFAIGWAADAWGRPAFAVVELAVGFVRWIALGASPG